MYRRFAGFRTISTAVESRGGTLSGGRRRVRPQRFARGHLRAIVDNRTGGRLVYTAATPRRSRPGLGFPWHEDDLFREAHLSAERPSPQAQARLPGPHVHAWPAAPSSSAAATRAVSASRPEPRRAARGAGGTASPVPGTSTPSIGKVGPRRRVSSPCLVHALPHDDLAASRVSGLAVPRAVGRRRRAQPTQAAAPRGLGAQLASDVPPAATTCSSCAPPERPAESVRGAAATSGSPEQVREAIGKVAPA